MELRTLKYFLMVAREENITNAAKLLHITQPTLSRQMAQLEEEFGVSLFERKSHKIILTEEGALLRRRAQEMITLSEKVKTELSFAEENFSGEIAIGCGELLSMDELGEVMLAFKEEHPLVRFEIHSGNAQSVKTGIEDGTLELGLFLEPVEIDKYNFIRMECKERWGVLVGKSSHLTHLHRVTPQDIFDQPIILPKNAAVNKEVMNWFGDYTDHVSIEATYNLLYNGATLVKKGMGSALCLELDASFVGTSFIPLSPELELNSVLAWKAGRIQSKITSRFIDFVKEYKKGISQNRKQVLDDC